jgi:hypothetical protein
MSLQAGANEHALVEALDADRLDAIAEFLTLASKFAGSAALAAEAGDLFTLGVRTRQTMASVREAAAVIATVGWPEDCP